MTIKTKSAVLAVTDIDELSTEQVGERLKETRVHIEAIRALWPGWFASSLCTCGIRLRIRSM